MNKHKASIIVIAAGIFWGAMGLFVNELSAAGLSSMQIAAVRMLGSALIFTTVLLIKDPR
jgi:EamA domain-containing membrane protein RarD